MDKDYSAFVKQWRHLVGEKAAGKRVRLTASFLASTGQTGTEEAKKIWNVVACSCSSCNRGETLAVNERRDSREALAAYAEDPEYVEYLRKYHVNKRNVRIVK